MIVTASEYASGRDITESGIADIYAIRNTHNGKPYIGSAVDIRNRVYNHFWHLTQGTHKNKKLLNAWRKHGASVFAFEVLEIVADTARLLEREQYWIDKCDSHRKGYNLNPKAESSMGIKRGSNTRKRIAEGARQAMAKPDVKERHKQATVKGMSSPEVKEKCRQAAFERWRNPDSKEKYIQAARKRWDTYSMAKVPKSLHAKVKSAAAQQEISLTNLVTTLLQVWADGQGCAR